MRLISPDYYPQFRCIADKCRHSCCIGWEIDIDTDTREKYRHVPGEFGQRLNAAIEDGEVSCFRMLKVGQSPTSDSDCLQSPSVASTRPCAEGWPVCPMLNQNGLCDLITELGEDHLCQICADHPRFRNYFSDRTEIGLGLCCEEAARIILSQEEPMRLIVLEDDGADDEPNDEEAALLALRRELIALMQDRARPIEARLDALLDAVNLAIPERDWAAVYRGLERLDPAWDSHIERLSTMGAKGRPESLHPFATAFEQFCVYLLYRHLPGALEDDDIPGRVAFCVLSTQVLMALCAAKADCTIADLLDFARMYSAEIEYSEDNIAALLDALWED